MIENLTEGRDGRTIRTPIENTRELQTERPVRMAARNALQRIANWTKVLKAAPEDVGN